MPLNINPVGYSPSFGQNGPIAAKVAVIKVKSKASIAALKIFESIRAQEIPQGLKMNKNGTFSDGTGKIFQAF